MYEPTFEEECRAKFQVCCALYKNAAFHVAKREYARQAYEQIDAYLDWRDIEGL